MKMQCDYSILSVLESLALSNNFQALQVITFHLDKVVVGGDRGTQSLLLWAGRR